MRGMRINPFKILLPQCFVHCGFIHPNWTIRKKGTMNLVSGTEGQVDTALWQSGRSKQQIRALYCFFR